jgi:hypothetical protein
VSGFPVRLSLLSAGAALLAAVAGPVPLADAVTVRPDVASLRAEIHDGTLLRTHGVTTVCAVCTAQVVTGSPGSRVPLSTTTPIGYGPAELAAAYHLPAAGVGATGTIVIVDAGAYPSVEADLSTYRAQYGLPPCTQANGCLTLADRHGGSDLPAPTTDPRFTYAEESVSLETALDLDMASAACPSCKLVEVQLPIVDAFGGNLAQVHAATSDFGDAVNTAAAMGASAVSMSYQFPSDPVMESGPIGQKLFHPGMAVLGSSGDSGYEGSTHVGWPANLPWVVSVGGTSLYPHGTGYTQIAWGLGGSGCETDLPAAVGQPAKVSANCGGHRAGSDVAAVADPATGVAVYNTYAPVTHQPHNWTVVGGTSASAPFVAGLYGRGTHLSQVIGPNTLYSAPKGAFTDVTIGQNALPMDPCVPQVLAICVAGKGWDGPTGIGVPNGLSGF